MRVAEIFENFRRNYISPSRPCVIAEAGVNHEGSMDIARRLIDEAAEGGADAIKFQTYKAHSLAVENSPAYWDQSFEPANSQFELFKRYDKFWKNEYEQLKRYCDDQGIDFLSTPFDKESATFLDDLVDAFKLASSDITNHPFIEFICQFNKPILLSTGASFMWEVHEAVDIIEMNQNDLCLLHCILNYPTEDRNANLGMILDLKKHFTCYPIGYSDHTMPNEMDALVYANLLGAVVLEKHFTHDKTLPGNDHYHAMNKSDLMKLREKLDNIYTLIGDFQKHPIDTEDSARKNARRSLVAAKYIAIGDIIEDHHLTWKRPAAGISPRKIKSIIGRKARVEIEKDEILNWDMLNG